MNLLYFFFIKAKMLYCIIQKMSQLQDLKTWGEIKCNIFTAQMIFQEMSSVYLGI